MGESTNHRLHVAQSADWKDAVISLVQPQSPYRPWTYGTHEAQEDDTVVYVLNTDPPTMLADVAHIDDSLDPRLAAFDRELHQPNLVELSTLAKVLDLELKAASTWHFDGDDAIKIELSLDECRYCCQPESRFGHTTMAAARTLLRFDGWCDGCEERIDLTGEDARDEIFVHTVDQYSRLEREPVQSIARDWPALLCGGCHSRMAEEGYTRFVDFKFAQHPPCPECGEQLSLRTFYGMPSDFMNVPPWSHAGGCCPEPTEWCCGACYHRW